LIGLSAIKFDVPFLSTMPEKRAIIPTIIPIETADISQILAEDIRE